MSLPPMQPVAVPPHASTQGPVSHTPGSSTPNAGVPAPTRTPPPASAIASAPNEQGVGGRELKTVAGLSSHQGAAPPESEPRCAKAKSLLGSPMMIF